MALSVVALLCSGGLLWFVRSLVRGPRDRAQLVLDLGGILVSMAGVVASVVIAVVQQRRPPGPQAIDDTDRLNRAAETLARAVRIQWEREAGMRSLLNPAPMRLHWSTTRRRQRFHGNFDEIGKQFSSLPVGRLVVLGKAGAGKTALALLLTLDLLKDHQSGKPVPVLLSASSWNPTEHLHDWIVRRLEDDYQFLKDTATHGQEAARQLLDDRRVLPILDGLDEMPVPQRAEAIRALNRDHPRRPLVVTCRDQEYDQAEQTSGELLAADEVVEIQPVTLDQVIEFLQANSPSTARWDEVLRHLRDHPNGALAEALSSPLMVALTRTIYTTPDREPRELVAIANAGDSVNRPGISGGSIS